MFGLRQNILSQGKMRGFPKHHIPWNKGLTRFTDNRVKKYAEKMHNEGNHQWKGDKVSLQPLHKWVQDRKPKPDLCERCKVRKPYDLANISGEYKRDINDYKYLCRKCHMESDGRMKNLKQNQEVSK
jgi:hypothetical protein